jgi:ATP-dependent RNA/DNA helicase IGHMBP2
VLRIGNPARVTNEMLRHTVDVQVQADKNYPRIKQMRRQADEYYRLARKYKRQFGKAEREQRKLLMTEARNLSREASELEKYLTDQLVENAQVITATLVGAASRLLTTRTFRTVFIDEAAQALEPGCWIPISRADRVIFAGDHCQLPPTIKSVRAQREGLSVTLFEKCTKRQPVSVMLRNQYRMNEQIMEFSSVEFYDGELEADNSVKGAVLGDDEWLAQPLTFIDTAGCGFDETVHPETQSIYNPEEAHLVLKHLDILLGHLLQAHPALITSNFRMGVISPYRAQIDFLQAQLVHYPNLLAHQSQITIGTVDGFQGQEREVIYISMVRSNTAGEIGFLNDIRRMNVALTRAKKKLVVVGDSSTLAYHSFYQAFLDYVMPIGAYQSAWEFME